MIFAFQFSTHTINVEMSLSQAYLIPVSPALCFRAFAQAMLLALSTPPLIHTHRWVPSLSAQQRGPTVLSQDTPASWLPQAGGLRLSGFGTREEPVTRQQAFSERSEAGGNPDEGESVCHLRSSRCVAAAIYGLEGWQSGGQGRARHHMLEFDGSKLASGASCAERCSFCSRSRSSSQDCQCPPTCGSFPAPWHAAGPLSPLQVDMVV